MISQDKNYKKVGILISIKILFGLVFFGINGCNLKETLTIDKISITLYPLVERVSFDSLVFFSREQNIYFDSVEMGFSDVESGNEVTKILTLPVKSCSYQKLETRVLGTIHFNPINNSIGGIFNDSNTVNFAQLSDKERIEKINKFILKQLHYELKGKENYKVTIDKDTKLIVKVVDKLEL
jgi:hypothetical protein